MRRTSQTRQEMPDYRRFLSSRSPAHPVEIVSCGSDQLVDHTIEIQAGLRYYASENPHSDLDMGKLLLPYRGW